MELLELTALVEKARADAGAFRPHAVFDEQMDCIRVLWRDCSANEIRVSELLTIVVDNYPASSKPECVGFNIKGIAHICESRGIAADMPWRLADFMDAVVAMDKPIGRYTLEKDLRPMVETRQELEEVELIPA